MLFNENIEDYKPYGDPQKIFNCFLDVLKAYQDEDYPAPYQWLTRAITHELLDHPLLAVEAYLQLLDKGISNPPLCIKKIKLIVDQEKEKKNDHFFDFLENLDRKFMVKLCNKIKDETLQELLLQKDAIRMYFERCLSIIQGTESQREKINPTCFISFAFEKSAENWLSKIFVPDLVRVGITPVYGPWHLSHANDLKSFQSQIRTTDLALVICTPLLKELCTEEVKAITGCAQEVRIVLERYNDEDKVGTLFTVLLHGRRKDCMAAPILEPIFAGKFEVANEERETDLYDYYSKAFRIFVALKAVKSGSQFAGELKECFIEKAWNVVLKRQFDEEQVSKWSEVRYCSRFAKEFG